MALVHATVATGTNDAAKQVSVNAWNAAHSISVSLNFPDNSASPATSPSSGLDLFCENPFQAWRLLGVEDSAGGVKYLCPHPLRTNIFKMVPGSVATAAGIATGIGFTFTATANSFAIQVPTAGSAITLSTRYTCVAQATAPSNTDIRPVQMLACRAGGFVFQMTYALRTTSTANRAFFGLMDTTSALGNSDWTTASTQAKIGVAINANTGNWKIVTGASGVAATNADLGANFPVNTTDFFRLTFFCLSSDTTQVFYKVENLTTGNSTTGTLSTNLPAASTFMTPHQYMTNNSNNIAVAFDSTGWYVETHTV
ncbi:hypothetical protein UFOVP605_15 [uncultured Caudovirales phage]|uniref:Uncharacterized protein n=1 Tax=uncultured Caudovirales phage TaxID=2100421 RepID=A0A6J5NAI9_9CAUD|nr:hypothetical protein UFOVP605_15 [uncultured Caudovirales phage]